MKLKVQMEKQRAYAIRKIKEATENNDIKQRWYWLGVRDAMDWAPGSRDDWKYVDNEVMSKEEKFDW